MFLSPYGVINIDMDIKLALKDPEELLKKITKKKVKLKTNLHVIESRSLRDVELVSKVPGLGEIGRVKAKVSDEVTRVLSTHNQVTPEGLYYFFNVMMFGLFQQSNIPISPSNSGSNSIIVKTSTGGVITLGAVAVPQVISPTQAIIYYIAVLSSPNSNLQIVQESLSVSFYVYNLSNSAGYLTNPIIFAQSDVTINVQQGLSYTFVWEIEIIDNFTSPQQYNTIVWLAYLFLNNVAVQSNSMNFAGIMASSGSSTNTCGFTWNNLGGKVMAVFTYTTSSGQTYLVISLSFNNPGAQFDIYGLIFSNGTSLLFDGNIGGFIGCQLVVFDNIDVTYNVPSSQEPILTFFLGITVESG